MTPRHHPDSDELLAYATGSTTEWLSLVIACHLTFCSRCRDEVAWCDEVGGALLEGLEDDSATGGSALTVPALPPRAAPELEAPPAAMPDPHLPRPLSRYFKEASPEWRFLAPGVRHIPLSLDVGGRPVRLVRFRPGYVIPRHSHGGGETLLIFHGSIDDSRTGATYASGDVCRSEVGSSHVQRVGAEEPCISLVVNEGPLVPASLIGRVLKWMTGL